MTPTASTATNSGKTKTGASPATTSEYFHVRIIIQHSTEHSDPHNTFLYGNDPVEVIKLRVVNNMPQLLEDVLNACQTTLQGAHARNGQSLQHPNGKGRAANEIKMLFVHWEPDSKGRETYTYAHDGNVEDVLGLLKERRGCNDLVVIEVDV